MAIVEECRKVALDHIKSEIVANNVDMLRYAVKNDIERNNALQRLKDIIENKEVNGTIRDNAAKALYDVTKGLKSNDVDILAQETMRDI